MFSFRIRCLNLCSNFCWLWVINFSLALLLKTRHFISGRSAFRYSDQRYIFPPMGHCVQSNQLKDTLWFPNAYSNLAKQRIKIRLAQRNRSFISKYYMPATTLADLKIMNHSQQLLVVRLEPATKRDVWLYHMDRFIRQLLYLLVVDISRAADPELGVLQEGGAGAQIKI